MSLGLIGQKLGMTRIFSEDGASTAVTVVSVAGNRVSQVKSQEAEGYVAVQLAFGKKSMSKIDKAVVGHLSKAGVNTAAVISEFRLAVEDKVPALGEVLSAVIFSEGQMVDVRGCTIGRGFSGTIRRHNFSSNRASHGNSRSHNVPGSISMAQDPGRVFPGKKMSGQYGAVQRTVQNLKVVRVDGERGLLWLAGAVPGHREAIVFVKPAVKSLRTTQ